MGPPENDREVAVVITNRSEDDRKFVLVDDEEFQQYLFAILSARTVGSLNTAEIGVSMESHFEKSNKSVAPPAMPRCQDTLDYMRGTLEAVDFFVEFCILIFVKAYGIPSNSRGIV